jgi:hypothetical protein
MDKNKVNMIAAIGVIGGIGLFICKGLANKHPAKYTISWIENLTDTEWGKEREIVRQKFVSPKYSDDTREYFKKILGLFDRVKSNRGWAGEKPGGPVRYGHGWYLPSDD